MKCSQCRDKDTELLTKWERFKNWLFYKINYSLFADDFNDLTSQKYTQGISDGRMQGIEAEKSSFERYQAMVNIDKPVLTEDQIQNALSKLLSNVDLYKVVTADRIKGMVYIGGVRVEEARLGSLKAEAEYFANSDLWALLYETPKELAQKSMFVEGDNLANMQKGRSILYTLSAQKNILDVFRSYQPKK